MLFYYVFFIRSIRYCFRLASFFGTLEQFKGTSTEADCMIWLRNKRRKIYSASSIQSIHNLKQLEWDLALEDDLEG